MILCQFGAAVKGILITFAFTHTLSKKKKKVDSVNIKKCGKYTLLNMTIV